MIRSRYRPLLLILGLAATGIACAAQPAGIRPGLWEFRSTRLNIGGLPDMSSQMAQAQQYIRSLPPDMRRMVEQQMAARGVSLGNDGSARSCITPEQAKSDTVYSGKTEGNCTLDKVVKADATVRGHLNCTRPDASGDFEARIQSPEHFTTRVNMTSRNGNLQVDTDARWLAADCGAQGHG
ncbi:DUF3617 domain-containing protein [Aromatoleum toluclasticum]|uniref:DUF3617 domain-containing protein n=1 Tax=Aromatoleum toluclasticum TaxID=92003 RepID=UPI000368BA36|nr:DUF3617 domain-containing protein [Aromatoleum toluclasticum]MCC4116421.1 DUF3617 domain-containing protein [Aromatoleum toluclasticum]